MALSLTSLEDAYAVDMDMGPPQPAIPALPDHGKKDRPVSLRADVPVADHGIVPQFQLKPRKAKAAIKIPVTESFTDKVWSHKKDMLKMLSLALIVAAGLAFHHVFLDFLTEYLDGARLTYWNEKVAKLCYPAIVLAIIWCIKSVK
jgi:hypothetical protein